MRYIPPKTLAPKQYSSSLYLKLPPSKMALFRFLLEAYENLAMFTTLEPKTALVKLIYSPDDQDKLNQALLAIKDEVFFEYTGG